MADMKIIIGAEIKELEQKLAVAKAKLVAFGQEGPRALAPLQDRLKGLTFPTQEVSKFSGAISNLGASLLSGGIALGISAAIAGLTALGKALFDVTEEQKRFSDVLNGAKSAYVKAVLEVDKMRDAFQKAKDGIISKETALKLYNSSIGKTIGQTDDLKVAEDNLNENAEKYIRYTLYKAAANIALGKATEAAFKAEEERIKGATKEGRFLASLAAGRLGGRSDAQRQQDRINKALKEQINYQEIYNNLIKEANLTGFKGLEQQEEEVEVIEKKIKRQREYNDLLPQQSFSQGKLKIIPDDLTVTPKVIVSPKIEFKVDPEQEKKVFDGLQKLFDAEKLENFQISATEAINATISNIVNDSIGSMAEAIGEVLANRQDALPNLFDTLIRGIGSQIKELGKYLVRIGVQMLIAKQAVEKIGLTPQTAIIAGFGLQVLAGALQAAFNKKLQGFASGTTGVMQGGFYDVGERGRERVFLPQGSKVQPANEVQAFSDGGVVLQPSIHYDGTGFRIMLNRVDAQMSRNG